MDIYQLKEAILDGDFDDNFEDIYRALKSRSRVISNRKAASFDIHNRVQVTGMVSPKYLRGAIGTVTGWKGNKVMVRLDESQGRFDNRYEVSFPGVVLQKVDLPPRSGYLA